MNDSSKKYKEKICEIFLKGLEIRCLRRSPESMLILSGIPLVVPGFRDIILGLLNLNGNNMANSLGWVLVISGIVLIFMKIDKRPDDYPKENKLYSSNSLDVREDNISYPKVTRKDYSLIKYNAGVFLIILFIVLWIYILILVFIKNLSINISYENHLYIWCAFFITVVVFTTLSKPFYKFWHIKKYKLLPITSNKCIEYGKDGWVYITSYSVTCNNCSGLMHIEYINGGYYFVCNEYSNDNSHTVRFISSDINKFSNP